jgi:S-(hydroxymethyl)glutathione dehydrogenase/alcohol dehydrogenase
MRKTKAAILSQINHPLEIDELIIPELKRGQVLVKIAYSGVCHSQLNEIRGLKGEDKFLPHTLGHEGSGIAMEVGQEVQKVQPGDHVVLTWIKGKGIDVPATQYHRYDDSIVNSGAISTFMEYAVISENRLVPIPEGMPLKEAALLGCAIPTGAGIVFNTLQAKAQDTIAIFGVGGIGMSAVIAAKTLDCLQIIAVDIDPYKLDFSLKIGATHVVNAAQQDPISAIMDLTGGQGVDYAIEAAGLKETMEKAFVSIKSNGGTLVIAGNLAHKEKISLDPFDLIKGKKIIGTWGGESCPDRDIPRYVELYLVGKLKIDDLITSCFCLNDINSALEVFKSGRNVIRVLIENNIS